MQFIVGVPVSVIDFATGSEAGYRVTMHVGERATLYLLSNASGDYDVRTSDTVRTVTWTMSNSSSAHLEMRTDGGVQIVAAAVGRVGDIAANQIADMRACGMLFGLDGCAAIAAIDIIP